ncbi:unnamed protein product [Protopolystoma xenopodis]|uniref:Uncharacterized protein n=1 Tax=Protopolystoma xenopodis TaxID=117903 RepID=A0A448X556_9PLAT|nr:unnamed protein product [Protopolystoma xenopodis]
MDIIRILEVTKAEMMLRAKLGLAPLNLDLSKSSGDPKKQDFVHAPAKNVRESQKADKLKEKLETLKEKRLILEKLRNTQSLGSGGETMTLSWVEKMRIKEKQKEEARNRNNYDSKDLAGLKIQHDSKKFADEKSIILTLKDKENVNLVDDEKADINRKNKRMTLGLGAIVDDDFEEVSLGLKAKGILDKYDVEIDGEKKDEIVLGNSGMYLADHERAMERLQAELRASAVRWYH